MSFDSMIARDEIGLPPPPAARMYSGGSSPSGVLPVDQPGQGFFGHLPLPPNMFPGGGPNMQNAGGMMNTFNGLLGTFMPTASPQAPQQQQGQGQGQIPGLQQALQGFTHSNPLQPFYAPNPPMGQATFGTAASSGADVSPMAAIQQILMGFAPQAARSTNALNNTLATMGVVGGGAADAQTALQGQLASSLAPTLANSIQRSQGMDLQQALANAGFQQQTGLANQNASNSMTSQNLANIIQQQGYNTSVANSAQQQLANAMQQGWEIPFQAFQQTNLAGLGGANSLLSGGLSGANNLAGSAANNFPVYQGAAQGMEGLGMALGNAFNSRTPSSSPYYGPNPATSSWDQTYSGP